MPSFTYPSDIVCVDPDVGDGVLWTRGRLSSVERSKPMVSRFTFYQIKKKKDEKIGKRTEKSFIMCACLLSFIFLGGGGNGGSKYGFI